MLVLRSSTSSMGDEEDRRELSEGLKEVELLSPCSTDRELGLSSKACTTDRGTLSLSTSTTSSAYLKSSQAVGGRADWMPNTAPLKIKSAVFSCSSVYHLAFDQLLDGAHQLRRAGRL